MRKTLIVLAFLACAGLAFSQTMREIIPRPGERDYRSYTKILVYYDASGEVTKVDACLTEALAAKTGFARQVTLYEGGIERSFEMFQTEASTARSGLLRRIDFVDAKDRLEGVELFFEGGRRYRLEKKQLDLLGKFPVTRLGTYAATFRENDPGDSDYVFEAPLFRGMADLGAALEAADATPEDTYLVTGWCDMHRIDDLSRDFPHKFLFAEGGHSYWIFVDEDLADDIAGREGMLLCYYYIGGRGTDPCFLAFGLFEPEAAAE